MKNIGIICEYNPFHNGHKYQIEKIKEQFECETRIVAVMSGNYVQRGDFAIYEKHKRAEMALNCGVDLVLELPITSVLSSAEDFAKGAIKTLENAGGVDYLCFGSELGDVKKLEKLVEITEKEAFQIKFKEKIKEGISYAKAMSNTLSEFDVEFEEIIKNPNNTLAVEYIKAIKSLKSSIIPLTIKREKIGHNDKTTNEDFASATYIRDNIKTEFLKFVPKENHELFCDEVYKNENAILSFLKRKDSEFFKQICGVCEGLENKIVKELKNAVNLEEFYDNMTSKRYTKSKIRRIVINSYLEITKDYKNLQLNAIKVLGFTKSGTDFIKERKKEVKFIIKPSAKYDFSLEEAKMFKITEISTDLYHMAKTDENDRKSGMEFMKSPVKK